MFLNVRPTLPISHGAWAGGQNMYSPEWGNTSWLVEETLQAPTWLNVSHSLAHCVHTLAASQVRAALVVVMDGGGNDGAFNIWRASRARGCYGRVPSTWNLGIAYTNLGYYTVGIQLRGFQSQCLDLLQVDAGHGGIAEVMMHLAAQGQPNPAWRARLREYFLSHPAPADAHGIILQPGEE